MSISIEQKAIEIAEDIKDLFPSYGERVKVVEGVQRHTARIMSSDIEAKKAEASALREKAKEIDSEVMNIDKYVEDVLDGASGSTYPTDPVDPVDPVDPTDPVLPGEPSMPVFFVPDFEKFSSTKEWERIRDKTRAFEIENNVWGKSNSPSMTIRTFGEGGKFGYSWNTGPVSAGNVKAYLQIIWGGKPWHAYDLVEGFHKQFKDISALSVDFKYGLSSTTGRYNSAFEFWAYRGIERDSAGYRNKQIAKEVMVWTEATYEQPGKRAEVELGGVKWGVHGTPGDVYVAFIPQSPIRDGKIDFSLFWKYLIEQGDVVTPDMWISGLEYGNEVIEGSGTNNVEKFVLEYK